MIKTVGVAILTRDGLQVLASLSSFCLSGALRRAHSHSAFETGKQEPATPLHSFHEIMFLLLHRKIGPVGEVNFRGKTSTTEHEMRSSPVYAYAKVAIRIRGIE